MNIHGEIERETERQIERQRIEELKRIWGNRTDEWLWDAARRGDVGSLKELIAKDEYILDKILVGGFKGRNPLHMAILTGQGDFVLELLKTKPELAEVLDTELGMPLHIASSKGHLEIVKHLVSFRPGMCMARDPEGNNPLHIAAMKGNVEVLKVLLRTSPQAARVRVDQGYSILHLCVNYNQLESLTELLNVFEDPEFISSTDTNGNSMLHLAIINNRDQMIKHMLSNSRIDVKFVNAINKSGRTALDIHSYFLAGNQTHGEIRIVLLNAGAKTSKEVEEPLEASWQIKRRNTFLIVASLIASVTFQVGAIPPGGFSFLGKGPEKSFQIVASLAIYDPVTYFYIMIPNTIAFLGSLTPIVLLTFAVPEPNRSRRWARGVITWLTILALVYTYVFSVVGASTIWNLGVSVACTLWILVMAVFVYRMRGLLLGRAIFVTCFLWMFAMVIYVEVHL